MTRNRYFFSTATKLIKLPELEQFETKIASLARIKGKLYQGNNGVGEEAEYKKNRNDF